MTRDELKRAFDICLDTHGCSGCPLLALEQQNGCDCRHNLFVSAIDLATEQEREIERLRTTLGQCNAELNSALGSLKSQCREIVELKAKVKQAKIEVLEKIKEYAVYNDQWNEEVVPVSMISRAITDILCSGILENS